jgi:FkbM family methyltransferase
LRYCINAVKDNFLFRAFVLKIEYQFRSRFHEIDYFIVSKLSIRTYVDVGANVGRYINLLKSNTINIVAFEPLKYLFKILRLIFRHKRIKLFNYALGKNNMNSVINYSKVFNEHQEELLSSMSEASVSNRFKYNKTERIKIIKGDVILRKYSNVDLIKIDTEGYEFKVVQGLRETIKKNFPILLIEIEKRHSRNFLRTFLFLTKINYNIYYCNKLNSLKLLNYKDIKNFLEKNQTIQKLKFASEINDWKKEAKTYNKYICNFWFVHPHSRLSSELQRFIS